MAKAKTSITTENRSGSAADAAAKEQRTEMPLSDLHPFEGHPFKVLDDELMGQTVESIKQIGVVSPLIVRPDPEGGFEILSGHRRLHAAQLAGLETVPVIVKEMDDDGRMVEIYLMVSLAPIPFATFGNHKQSHTGQNYLRSLFALGFQGFLIMICVGIYAVLIQNLSFSDNIISSIWGVMGYTVLLAFTLFKTGSLAKSVFAAH